jgi:UDP-glucose 4-epimerase
MRIFMTGATGFVGRNFLAWLLAYQPNLEITCLVRDVAKVEAQWPRKPGQVRWLAGDLLEPATYRAAIRQAERVFHLAALVSLTQGGDFHRMNVEATRCLVAALTGSGHLERLVFLSSISAVDRSFDVPAVGPLTEAAIPQPSTEYGQSKRRAEECIAASGLPYTILRPPYIFGPHLRQNSSLDRLIQDISAGKAYLRFPFPGQVSVIAVEDLAEMLWLAGHHPGTENQTFFAANPEPVRIADAVAAIAQALSVPLEPLSLSAGQIERVRRRWYAAAPANPIILRILFEDFFYCSVDSWMRTTGHRPRIDYRTALAQLSEQARVQKPRSSIRHTS